MRSCQKYEDDNDLHKKIDNRKRMYLKKCSESVFTFILEMNEDDVKNIYING